MKPDQKFKELLLNSNNILTIMAAPPDFDSIGSGLIIKKYIEALGKLTTLICPIERTNKIAKDFSFLPFFEEIEFKDTIEVMKQKKFDCIVLVDGANFIQFYSQKNKNLPDFSNIATVIHIDHHLLQPEKLGTHVFHEVEVSSTCELIINDLIPKTFIDKDIATLAYAGIVGDTGNFKWSLHSSTFKTASLLLERKANVEQVLDKIFFSHPKSYFKIYSWVIDHIELVESIKAVCLTTNKTLLEHFTTEEQLQIKDIFFENFAKHIEGYNIGILIQELADGKSKISIRGNNVRNKLNLPEICKLFGGNGGGHFHVSGAVSELSPIKAKEKVVSVLEREYI